jgi:hypothetical protein
VLLAADSAYELDLPEFHANTPGDDDGDFVPNSVVSYLLDHLRPTFIFDGIESNPSSPSEQYFVTVAEFLFRSRLVEGPYENPALQTVLDGRPDPTTALRLWRENKFYPRNVDPDDEYSPHLQLFDTTPKPIPVQQAEARLYGRVFQPANFMPGYYAVQFFGLLPDNEHDEGFGAFNHEGAIWVLVSELGSSRWFCTIMVASSLWTQLACNTKKARTRLST